MSLTVADFEKRFTNVTYYGKSNQEDKNHSWIVQDPFCTHCINYARYPKQDGLHRMLKSISVQKTNLKFVQMFDVETPRNLTSYKVVAVESLRNIK